MIHIIFVLFNCWMWSLYIFWISYLFSPFSDCFAVPPSVLTSEVLLPCRSSRHSYFRPHPRLIPHRGPAARGPQEETSGRWRAATGRRHSIHCCRVTSVVFSDACSDSAYAGHHVLCPLLTTMLAKWRNQTEWTSPPPERRPPLRPFTNAPEWSSSLTLTALIWTAPGEEIGRNTETELGHYESMVWMATEVETILMMMQR